MVNRLCKVKRVAIAAAISLGWCGPAIAQSVFIDPGESAVMVAGTVLDGHGEKPAWIGTIAGSVRGGVDLFLSVGPSSRERSGAAGISRLLSRSRVLSGSIGAGVIFGANETPTDYAPETVVAPFLTLAINSILERGRWRLIPELGVIGSLSIGTGDVPMVGAEMGLALQSRVSPSVALVLDSGYAIADRLGNAPAFGVDPAAYKARSGVAYSLGLVVRSGARPRRPTPRCTRRALKLVGGRVRQVVGRHH